MVDVVDEEFMIAHSELMNGLGYTFEFDFMDDESNLYEIWSKDGQAFEWSEQDDILDRVFQIPSAGMLMDLDEDPEILQIKYVDMFRRLREGRSYQ